MKIEEVAESLSRDFEKMGSYDRYPVRFLSAPFDNNTSNFIIELYKYIQNNSIYKNCVILDIKNWLIDVEWITKEKFIANIKKLECDCNYIIVGFTEYARFLSNSEFVTVIESLLEIENAGDYLKRRLYVPCFALYSQISKTVDFIHRRIDAYNPFLNETAIEDLPLIYFVDEDLDNTSYDNTIHSSQDWFSLWQNSNINFNKPIICLSKTLLFLYEQASPDNVYNIRKIVNYEDMLRYLYKIENIVPFEADPDQYYIELLKLIRLNRDKSLKNIILEALNIQNVDDKNAPIIWKSSNKFKRWLLKNYIMRYYYCDTYLWHMMRSINDMHDNEFNRIAYDYIFFEKKYKFYEERKKLLETIVDTDKNVDFGNKMKIYYEKSIKSILSESFNNKIEYIDFTSNIGVSKEINSMAMAEIYNNILSTITTFSTYERQLILWMYYNRLLRNDDIEKIYPEFIQYLYGDKSLHIDEIQINISRYFENYRKCRIGINNPENYESMLKEWNLDSDGFYKWYFNGKILYPETILRKTAFCGKIIVLDGVGGEFLEYITYCLKSKGYKIELSTYGKAHLPTITMEARKHYPSVDEWIDKYDREVIHGEYYYCVKSLEKSLCYIKQMLESIVDKYAEEKIAIIADHGATVNHKIVKRNKKYEFESADHAGRCYRNTNCVAIDDSEDYIKYDDGDGTEWLIALKEQSLYKNSPYAVHGGATPEEVFVPVIIAEPAHEKITNYKVLPQNLRVHGIENEVVFKIIPNPTTAVLQGFDGTNEYMKYNETDDTWVGVLKQGIEQRISICVGKQEFKFTTIPKTIMKGNDGFDD